MSAANIKSNYTSPLGLPGGPVIPAGRTVRVEKWDAIKDHPIVKSWLDAEVIEVVKKAQEEDDGKPDSDASAGADAKRGTSPKLQVKG